MPKTTKETVKQVAEDIPADAMLNRVFQRLATEVDRAKGTARRLGSICERMLPSTGQEGAALERKEPDGALEILLDYISSLEMANDDAHECLGRLEAEGMASD